MSRVLVSGASGFIGSHLVASYGSDGHTVTRLARRGEGVRYEAERGVIDRKELERAEPDIVVNLAGAPIPQRWTAHQKRRIRESRIVGTAALASALAVLVRKPAVLVSGSGIGYYGAHRGDELLDETSSAGDDFLATTAREWEDATRPASDAGIRVVLVRTGIVLGAKGGALKKMLLPFRFGAGGPIGDGRQWMSWIDIDDMVRALRFVGDSAHVSGAVNAVAPNAVQNVEFARVLGRMLHRPAVLPLPAFALRVAFGEMADNAILASQRVVPKKLAGAGFEFRHPQLEDALRSELTR
jgi:uncharacterized protein (TIGR01777 family)